MVKQGTSLNVDCSKSTERIGVKSMISRKILLGLLASLVLSTTAFAAGEPHIFFGPPAEGQPMLEDHLVEYINGAEKTLDCCFFDVKSWPLTEAFVAAANRGVKVRFVTDDGRYWSMDELKREKAANRKFRKEGSDEKYVKQELRKQIKALVDAGIDVRNDDRGPLMHNKFCVKDGRFVWTGSYNITEPGTLYNTNNSLWIENEKLAEIFTREFDEMYHDDQYGGGPTLVRENPSAIEDQIDSTNQTVRAGGMAYEVLFAPEDRPNDRILEIIKNATDEIYFMHYAFTHDGIGDTCVEKHIKGLKVEGVFDHLLYRSTGPTAEFCKLTNAGISVSVVRPHKGIQHNKVFIVDPHTDHGIVVTGSLNISDSGGDKNDENTIIIHDSATAMKYYNRYKEIQTDFSDDVVAEVLSPKPAVAKQVIEEMIIHIVTNGKPVETVSIELPARWKVKDEIIDNSQIFRGSEDITASATKLYKSNRIVFSNINLEATGDLRSLRIVLNDVPAAKKPGLYSFYVKAGKGTDHRDLEPLRELPTLEVFDPKDLGDMNQGMQDMHSMLDNLIAITAEANTEEKQQEVLHQYNETLSSLESTVFAEITSGDFESVMKVCNFVEKCEDRDSLIFKAVMDKLLSFRKIVLSQAIHSDNDELHELAQHIHDLCAGFYDSSELTPLSATTTIDPSDDY
jgi:phosphatidylserine/phosphatidylglycerophosphate/cardiolipin synthase-like enzyme